VRRRPFDPSNLSWVVSQCPFDPYQAGAKVYWAYQAGRRAGGPDRQPAPQTTLGTMIHNVLTSIEFTSHSSIVCSPSVCYDMSDATSTVNY
jgi:hypothetical protein